MTDDGRARWGDQSRLARFAAEVGYATDELGHLVEAVTHKSYANEAAGEVPYNERLEFLGDAVLGMLIAEALMSHHPNAPEGDLSRLRASLVNSRSLAEIAEGLDLGAALRLGRGEQRSGGRRKESLLADAYEATIGAIFLDLGLDAARTMVRRHFATRLAAPETRLAHRDFKTQVQEIVQRHFQAPPTYVVRSESGPDHDKQFEVELCIHDRAVTTGQGRSKKLAERDAARNVWPALQALEAGGPIESLWMTSTAPPAIECPDDAD